MIKCVFVNNTISKLKSFSITYNFWDVIKELERRLAKEQLPISPQRAIELTQTMYELRFELPNDSKVQHISLKMDTEQQMLYACCIDQMSQC